MIRFNAPIVTVEAALGEPESRVISGVAVPYSETAQVSDGTLVRFAPGSLPVEGKAPKLFMYHDSSMAVGIVTDRVESDAGMLFSAKVSRTAMGDDAMTLALDGVLDSVSVGVNPVEYTFDEATKVMTITKGDWLELSLVPIPAFAGATISSVTASIHQEDEESVIASSQEPEEENTPMEQPAELVPTEPIFASAKREPRLPNAAEFVAAMHKGGEVAAAANRVWEDYRNYNKSSIQAAAGDEVLSNLPGVVPVPILGPVFEDINYIAPVLTYFGSRAMPNNGASATFVRPTWTTHVSAAQQSAEFDPVSATTGVIASNVVTKRTFAGQVSMSVQTIDFTDPAAMGIILQDLSGQYLTAVDNFAADNLLAAASSDGVWDLTATDLMKSIYDSAVTMSSATNFLPTTIAVDPATWALIGQLVDGANRPIFPTIGAPGLIGQNSLGAGSATSWSGMNPLGLDIVVDNKFAAKTMVICNKNAFEIYRQDRGLLSVETPSTLGRTMSIYGYAATFAANSNMIRKITQA